jgi:hypothetical protein
MLKYALIGAFLLASASVRASAPGADQRLMVAVRNSDRPGMLAAGSQKENRGGLTRLMVESAVGSLPGAKEALRQNDHEFFTQSESGYSAFMYAVAGGHLDVVQYLLDEARNGTFYRLLQDRAISGWTPIAFATAYRLQPGEDETDRIRIFDLLVEKGADTSVVVEHSVDGAFDLIAFAALQRNARVLRLVRQGYEEQRRARKFQETYIELRDRVLHALSIVVRHEKQARGEQFGEVTKLLSAWDQDLRSYQGAVSRYQLAAGAWRASFGVIGLELVYAFDGRDITHVTLREHPIGKEIRNSTYFSVGHLVRYFGVPLTEEEREAFGDDSEYEPKNPLEAYVLIQWKYSRSSAAESPGFLNPSHPDLETARKADRDDGLSVIRIDVSSGRPTSDVVEAGGTRIVPATASGLTKIVK